MLCRRTFLLLTLFGFAPVVSTYVVPLLAANFSLRAGYGMNVTPPHCTVSCPVPPWAVSGASLCLMCLYALRVVSFDSMFAHFSYLCGLFVSMPTLAFLMGRSLKKTRLVETLDTTSIFSGTVLSREWSVVLDLLLFLDNEITREMHDNDF